LNVRLETVSPVYGKESQVTSISSMYIPLGLAAGAFINTVKNIKIAKKIILINK